MEPINGLHGHVYDENGQELSTTQEFEGNVEFQKEAFKLPGQFMEKHKVLGGSGSGSIMFLKVDSRLQRKIAENPTEKYNYVGKLTDPTANGEEAVLFIGVSFDAVPLAGHTLGEMIEVELDFTFDNYRYLDSIE
jgi:hypothetical protein